MPTSGLRRKHKYFLFVCFYLYTCWLRKTNKTDFVFVFDHDFSFLLCFVFVYYYYFMLNACLLTYCHSPLLLSVVKLFFLTTQYFLNNKKTFFFCFSSMCVYIHTYTYNINHKRNYIVYSILFRYTYKHMYTHKHITQTDKTLVKCIFGLNLIHLLYDVYCNACMYVDTYLCMDVCIIIIIMLLLLFFFLIRFHCFVWFFFIYFSLLLSFIIFLFFFYT